MEEEIEFILKVITHPVGYDLGLFGTMCVRPTDQGAWCVSWEDCVYETKPGFTTQFLRVTEKESCFPTPREAAEFFVKKRTEIELGLDFEISANAGNMKI